MRIKAGDSSGRGKKPPWIRHKGVESAADEYNGEFDYWITIRLTTPLCTHKQDYDTAHAALEEAMRNLNLRWRDES